MQTEESSKTSELDLIVYQDLTALSDLLDKDLRAGTELRNCSVVLRSLLIYGNLKRVADRHGVEIVVRAPSVEHLKFYAGQGDILFYQSFHIKLAGLEVLEIVIPRHAHERPPVSMVDLKLSKFLGQKVLFYNGTFISREEVIKYVANKLGAAHFDERFNNMEREITEMRKIFSFRIDSDGVPAINFNPSAKFPNGPPLPFRLSADWMDIVQLQNISTIRFLMQSESVRGLIATLARTVGKLSG